MATNDQLPSQTRARLPQGGVAITCHACGPLRQIARTKLGAAVAGNAHAGHHAVVAHIGKCGSCERERPGLCALHRRAALKLHADICDGGSSCLHSLRAAQRAS